MAFVDPGTPNITDFWEFLNTSVQIPAAALPNTSPYPQYALNQAIALVLNPPAGLTDATMYSLACYNCATHLLLIITPDQPGQTWFAKARGNPPNGFALNQISTGLVVSASDESTSSTLAEPKWASGLTVGQLDFMRTPWGRSFLNWNQNYGPNIVGLT